MKKTEKRLDIHGCVDYYIGARVEGMLCARTAMMREIAPMAVTSAEYVRSSGG